MISKEVKKPTSKIVQRDPEHLWCFYLAKKSESPFAKLEFSWGTKKIQKLNHRVHSTSLPRHGASHDTFSTTCLYTPEIQHGTWKEVPGKGDSFWKPSFSGSMLNFGGSIFHAVFTVWMYFSLTRHFRSQGLGGSLLIWIDQNVQWPTTRYSSIFATKRCLVWNSSCAYLGTFWDGSQWIGTVRNEMLLTVLKIISKFSPKN